MKRIISLLMTIIMCISIVPVPVKAIGTHEITVDDLFEKYPQYLLNEEVQNAIDQSFEICFNIIGAQSKWDDFKAVIKSLKEGAGGIALQWIFSTFHWGNNYQDSILQDSLETLLRVLVEDFDEQSSDFSFGEVFDAIDDAKTVFFDEISESSSTQDLEEQVSSFWEKLGASGITSLSSKLSTILLTTYCLPQTTPFIFQAYITPIPSSLISCFEKFENPIQIVIFIRHWTGCTKKCKMLTHF